MTIWIVGKVISDHPEGKVWEFEGAFDQEALAVAACMDHRYFVGPVELNDKLPEETTVWPRSHYPIQETT